MSPEESRDPFYFFDFSTSGRLARETDWDRHPLGRAEQWPSPLKSSLSLAFRHPQAMMLFWGQEHYCFFNDALMSSLGRASRPREIGLPGQACLPELWKSMQEPVKETLASGRPSQYLSHMAPNLLLQEGRIEGVDWTYIYTPVFSESGQTSGVLVTWSKSARTVFGAQALKASEEHLKLALASGQMGTWTVSLTSRDFTLSDEAYRIFGLGRSDSTNNVTIDALIHPEDRDRVRELLSNAIRTGASYTDKYRIIRPDGEVRWLNSRGQAIYDNKSRPFLLAGIVMDITESKAVEEARSKNASLGNHFGADADGRGGRGRPGRAFAFRQQTSQ